jgi:predicted glycoside hydrolase/deacetylase ChbG (UPF0249 family)
MNLAERMGHPAQTRLLVLHADDLGCALAANAAAWELMEVGLVTSGSVIVPAPFLGEVAAHQRAHPDADIGVHLALTSEHPRRRWAGVLGPRATPSLHDDDGYLPLTVEELLDRADPDEAARELRAQVEKAIDAGIDVTHLDSHMGAVFHRKFFAAWCRLAVEFELPTFIPAAFRNRPPVQQMEAAGVPAIDLLLWDTYGPGRAEKPALFDQMLADLPAGFSHFLVHPTPDVPEVHDFLVGAETRITDYELFSEGAIHRRLGAQGVQLTGYRALRDWLRAQNRES